MQSVLMKTSLKLFNFKTFIFKFDEGIWQRTSLTAVWKKSMEVWINSAAKYAVTNLRLQIYQNYSQAKTTSDFAVPKLYSGPCHRSLLYLLHALYITYSMIFSQYGVECLH